MLITRGTGLRNNQGREVDAADLVDTLLDTDPASTQEWWSPHRWSNASRGAGQRWLGSSAVVVDMDLKHDGAKVPVDVWADDLLTAWDSALIPGSIFHLTPHGVRVIFMLTEECTDPHVYTRAVMGAHAEVEEVVRGVAPDAPWSSDTSAMCDRKRLLWMPATTDEKGLVRRADVYVREDEEGTEEAPTWPVEGLASWERAANPPPPPPPPTAPTRPDTPRSAEAVAEYEEAAARFNESVSPATIKGVGYEYADAPNRACPVCSHSECFGPLKAGAEEVRGSWVCYSTNHVTDAPGGVEVGRAFTTPTGGTGWKGDTLDLAAWSLGQSPTSVLINAGYLKPNVAPPPPADPTKPAVFLPKQDPMHVSVGDFINATLTSVPEGTFYRFAGEPGVLRRDEGLLAHRPLRSSAMAVAAGEHVEARTHVVRKEGVQEVRTNLGKVHGQWLIDGATTHPSVRELRGVYTSPVVAGDFAPMTPGWNPGTGLYYDEPRHLRGLRPAIDMSTEACREVLDLLLDDFYDVLTDADLANAVGLIVTALVRPSLVGHPVPLHFANASMEGSGKSILMEHFVGTLLTGAAADNFHVADSSDENAKAMLSYARGGRFLVVFDNIPGGSVMDEAHLASTITRPTIVGRRLGHTEVVQMPNRFVPMGTGNNVSFSPELARRVVPINFQPKDGVDVYTRTFRHPDFRAHIERNRVLVLNTLLGAVERWKAAGRPVHESGRALPGFERWSAAVGGIVSMLGFPEWLDGVDEWRATKGNPVVEAMRSFCAAWWGDSALRFKGACKAKELVGIIEDDPGALGIKTKGSIVTALGFKLREMVGRTDLRPYRVHDAGMRAGSRSYSISHDEQDTPN